MKYYGRDRDIQIKVGLMTLFIILALLLGYSWLRDWFGGRQQEVLVGFTHAGNIEVGDPVTVYGVKRGRVDDVMISEEGVILKLSVELDFPLSKDTDFFISDSNLMGSRQVDIIPGSSEDVITAGYVAKGESLGSLASLVPKIDMVISEISSLTEVFSQDEDMWENLSESLLVLNSIAFRINSVLEESDESITDAINNINLLAGNMNELFADNKDNFEQALLNANAGIIKLEESLSNVDSLLVDLKPVVRSAAAEEGTIGRLLSDEDLYFKLLKTAGQIDSLLTDIQDNPRRYFKFSIF